MREFFHSVKFKVFLVIACLLVGLMLRSASTGQLPTVTQNIVSVVISPFQRASSYISNGFSGMIDNVTSLGSLKTENDDLKKQVTNLRKQVVSLNDIKRKYDRIKDLANITDEGDNRKYTTAAVISRDSGQYFSAFTIDEGTIDGVKTGDPVITSEGLVGIVVRAGLNTSVVSTILDPSVYVGSTISQTGDTGITCGTSELYAKGEFELSDIEKNSSITTGDIIVTTGKNGIYPKNLCIGTVQSIEQDSSGSSLIAVCRPVVDPTTVKDVIVITDFSGKKTYTVSSSKAAKGGK